MEVCLGVVGFDKVDEVVKRFCLGVVEDYELPVLCFEPVRFTETYWPDGYFLVIKEECKEVRIAFIVLRTIGSDEHLEF